MLIATTLLVLSCVGLIGLVLFKAWELKSETFLFSPIRIRIGAYSHRMLEGLRAEFPRVFARTARITGRLVRAYASFGIASALIAFEKFLERTLRVIKTAPRELERRGEASPFLREVAAYKRMIARASRKEEEGAVLPEAGSSDTD